MLRVCSRRGINAISMVWHKHIEEPRQVTMFSAPGAHRAIIESASPSAVRHLILIAARNENGATYSCQSACFRSLRNRGTCNSIRQPGGAE